MITSKQNPKLKLARTLMGRTKERQEAGGFVAEGVRLVEEALGARWPFQFVLYSHPLTERGEALLERLIAADSDRTGRSTTAQRGQCDEDIARHPCST